MFILKLEHITKVLLSFVVWWSPCFRVTKSGIMPIFSKICWGFKMNVVCFSLYAFSCLFLLMASLVYRYCMSLFNSHSHLILTVGHSWSHFIQPSSIPDHIYINYIFLTCCPTRPKNPPSRRCRWETSEIVDFRMWLACDWSVCSVIWVPTFCVDWLFARCIVADYKFT